MILTDMSLDTWLVLGILIVEIIDFLRTRWEWKQEFEFDRNIYEKKQRRTRTTKKTTSLPSGEVITEENVESVESKGESK